MSAPSIHIAIVGGGITGLAFAIALARSGANVDVDIYESAPSFSEVGAGIGFFPRILEDLRFLGFAADMEAKSLGGKKAMYRKGDESDCRVWGDSEGGLQTLHRADFLDVLLKHLPTEYRTHFGKRLASYTDSTPEPVVLNFKDGSTATCDVLFGADGIKSATRKTMYEKLAQAEPVVEKANVLRDFIQPKWTGRYVYRALIPQEELAKVCPDHPALDSPQFLCGKCRYMFCYPISQGRLINCVAMTLDSEKSGTVHDEPWVTTVPKAEVRELFSDWSAYVQNVVDVFAEPSRWVVNCVADLPTYVSGRVAIMGDAAHAMTPHLGSGAAQGIEDGLLLATLFAQPNMGVKHVPTILKVFDEVRRPFSQDVLLKSHRTGMMQLLDYGELREYSAEASMAGEIPEELLKRVSQDIANEGRFTWTTSAKDDREKAVGLLLGRVRSEV